jgi:MerR family mercuric resistance operon transcriptional regulator
VSESLTIGAQAKAANVHVETIRYYQRRGLLREPARPPNGIRHYGFVDVTRLRFIKHAQQSGFTLAEVGALLGLSGRPACGASRTLAATKLVAVEDKMRILTRLRRELRAWVAACDVNTEDHCPALEKLGALTDRLFDLMSPTRGGRV